jgi:hypothetical protein
MKTLDEKYFIHIMDENPQLGWKLKKNILKYFKN